MNLVSSADSGYSSDIIHVAKRGSATEGRVAPLRRVGWQRVQGGGSGAYMKQRLNHSYVCSIEVALEC